MFYPPLYSEISKHKRKHMSMTTKSFSYIVFVKAARNGFDILYFNEMASSHRSRPIPNFEVSELAVAFLADHSPE